MSNKFTGITSAGSAIPVYDKDAHSALEQKLDTSAFSSVSGDFLTEVPESAVSGFATHEEVESATSGKLDTTAASGFVPLSGSSAMSGDFIIAPYGLERPPVLSANVYHLHIRAAANAPYSQLTYGDLQFRNSPAGRITDSSARFSYDPGVEIYAPTFGSNYPRQVIIVKGTDVNSATISSFIVQQPTSANNRPIIKTHDQGDSIEWHSVTGKLDASAADNFIQKSESGEFQPSGDYYSASNPSGFLVPDDITGKQDASAMTAYQPVGDYQPSGDYLSASESANFYPMTGNPSGFLTEHQSLDGYLQNSDLTIVDDKITEISGVPLSAGDELPESVSAATDYITATSGDINATIDNVSSNSGAWGGNALPISARDGLDLEMSGGMLWIGASALNETLSGKQDTLTFEYNESSAISAINGSALAGGGDVPEGVMAESGLGYNAVNEISGYNGSAFATLSPEKQWLVHDDTLVHAANSAQYALGVNLSAVAQLLGVDETVLYSATPKNYGGESSGESITLNESISSFERLRFYINVMKGQNSPMYYETYEVDNYLGSACNFQYGPYPENNVTTNWFILRAWVTDNICNVSATYNASTSVQNPYWGNKWFPGSLYKVVGIGRKEV